MSGLPGTPSVFVGLGYLAGWGVFLLLRWLEPLLLRDPCAGHTLYSLLGPFLLGPGGLALALTAGVPRHWRMIGVGLAVASLFPAMYFAAQSWGVLREIGCAPLPAPQP